MVGAKAAASIRALVDGLCNELQKARNEFATSGLFTETANRCCDLLDSVISLTAPPDPIDNPFLDAGLAMDRYTMETERHIHRAVTGGAMSAAVEDLPDSPGLRR